MGPKNPAEEYFERGLWGYDGTQWRKLALLWGYTDRWIEAVEDAANGGANATILTTAVPPGYVYVLEGIHAYHDAAAAKDLAVYLYGDSTILYLYPQASTDPDVYFTWDGRITLGEGDRVGAIAYAAGVGKKVYLAVWGYKMGVG